MRLLHCGVNEIGKANVGNYSEVVEYKHNHFPCRHILNRNSCVYILKDMHKNIYE